MGEDAGAAAPFYLTGNFAPVEREVTAFDLPVDGELPASLTGLFVRNGPNPRGADPGHWFLGDGMLHGVRLDRGRASWYRNRWVRTRYYHDPKARFASLTGKVDRSVSKANTHVIGHAGRLFALVETSFPTEVDAELDTIGPHDFDGKLDTAFTAHPKLCPRTGELHLFGYGYSRPYLTYHRLDADGVLAKSEVVPVKGSTLMHDFAITESHVVFMDLPVVLKVGKALLGRSFPYGWSDDYGARLGVMPRDGSGADTRWFEIEPCFIFHTLNAFESDGVITLDAARYEELWRDDSDTFSSAALHRYRIDLRAGTATGMALDDRPIEFPRIDPRREGRQHASGYFVGTGALESQVLRYALEDGTCSACDFGAGCTPSEAVFAPAPADLGDAAGWLLTFVHDRADDTSRLVVLDGAEPARGPVASVALPQRVPAGFHGSWIPDPDSARGDGAGSP